MEEALCYVSSTQMDDGRYHHMIRVPRCPYCYFAHSHSDVSAKCVPFLGFRVAHCSISPERQINKGVEYKLVLLKENHKKLIEIDF